MRTGAVYPRKANTYWPIFYFLPAERMTRQRRPLLHPQTRGLMLLARCWKRSLQHNTCSGDANRSGLPVESKYLLANILLSTSGEDDEATSPSSSFANVGIDASSELLKALVATKYMQWGCEQERFTCGKQILVC